MIFLLTDGAPMLTTHSYELAGHRSDARVRFVSARALTARPSTAQDQPIVKSAQLTHTARRTTPAPGAPRSKHMRPYT